MFHQPGAVLQSGQRAGGLYLPQAPGRNVLYHSTLIIHFLSNLTPGMCITNIKPIKTGKIADSLYVVKTVTVNFFIIHRE